MKEMIMIKKFALLLGIVLIGAGVVFHARVTRAQVSAHSEEEKDRASKHPVQIQATIIMDHGTPGFRKTLLTVPKNEELIIEYISCNFEVPGGQFLGVSMETIGGGGDAQFIFPWTKQGTIPPTGKDVLTISQQMRIFGDSETNVDLEVERSTDAGDAAGGCSVAGELRRKLGR
jgi:hypothetical protein